VSQYGPIHLRMLVFVMLNFCCGHLFPLKFQLLIYAFVHLRVTLPHLIYFSDMENIGDKDAAIAERVRALLAAANSTAAPAVAAVPPRVVAVPASVTTPVGARRLDASADPATVVANLTVAGIRYALSYLNLFFFLQYKYSWIRYHLWIRNVLTDCLLYGSF
jgi:hypothetical protein